MGECGFRSKIKSMAGTIMRLIHNAKFSQIILLFVLAAEIISTIIIVTMEVLLKAAVTWRWIVTWAVAVLVEFTMSLPYKSVIPTNEV